MDSFLDLKPEPTQIWHFKTCISKYFINLQNKTQDFLYQYLCKEDGRIVKLKNIHTGKVIETYIFYEMNNIRIYKNLDSSQVHIFIEDEIFSSLIGIKEKLEDYRICFTLSYLSEKEISFTDFYIKRKEIIFYIKRETNYEENEEENKKEVKEFIQTLMESRLIE